MNTTKTLTGIFDALVASDKGGWIRHGKPSAPLYFRWADSPGLKHGIPHGAALEFELAERNGRPVAINVRRITGGNHADT